LIGSPLSVDQALSAAISLKRSLIPRKKINLSIHLPTICSVYVPLNSDWDRKPVPKTDKGLLKAVTMADKLLLKAKIMAAK
jgi:hypothetical protein